MIKNKLKLSLITAITITSFSTNANAINLGKELYNTELNGMLRYQHTKTENSNTTKEYKVELETQTKIEDTLLLTLAAEQISLKDNGTTNTHDITQANLTCTGIDTITTTIGKTAYALPITDGSSAYGARAKFSADEATITLGGFENSTKIAMVTIPVGSASLTGLYSKMGDWDLDTTGKQKADFTYFNAQATLGKLSLSITNSNKDIKADSTKNELTSIVASTEINGFNIDLGYAKTGKDGGDTAMADGGDAGHNFALEELNSDSVDTKANITLINISKEVYPNTTISLGQANLDYDLTTADQKETLFTAQYNVNNNLFISGWISNVETDGSADVQKTRVEVKYTF